MNAAKMVLRIFIFLSITRICLAQNCQIAAAVAKAPADTNSIETILQNLNEQTASLKSYQSRIEYRFSQPLLESQALRTGAMYYLKSDGRSNLRINFQTLRQDEEKEQKYIEQYIFDGVWLTVIDYQIKQVKKYQLADVNKPADAFELAANNFPIIGFSSAQDLKKDFEIQLIEQKQSESSPVIPAKAGIQEFIQLYLKVKPDSVYKDNYSAVEFYIDKKINLPAKIIAFSTEGDIYEIKLLEPKINRPIDKEIFKIKIPQGFGAPEIIPIEKTDRK